MEILFSYVIGSLPLIPVVTGVLLSLLRIILSYRPLFNTLYIISSAINFLMGSILFYRVFIQSTYGIYCFGGWYSPIGICFIVDKLSSIMILIAVSIYLIVSIYAVWYTRHMANYVYFYVIALIHEAGLLGIFLTSDIFNLYVFIELAGLTAYSLILFYHHRLRSLLASARYAFAGALYTGLFLLAIVILYATTDTLSIAELIAKIKNIENLYFNNLLLAEPTYLVLILLIGLWTAFLISALYPNHFWLPDAHSEAPSPASAILSGLTVNAGVYIAIRLLYTLYYGSPYICSLNYLLNAIVLLGIINIVYGSFKMAIEDDVKRILAYSTILNMGFIYMGIGIGTPLGISASLLHLVNHSIGKMLAFISLGVIVRRYRTRNIYALEGLGRNHPVTMAILIASILHLIGVPPFGGFFSKLLLFQAFIDVGGYIYALMIIIGTALSLYGYMRLIEHLWHHPVHHRPISKESLPIAVIVAYTLSLMIFLVLGIFSQSIIPLFNEVGEQVIHGSLEYIKALSRVVR